MKQLIQRAIGVGCLGMLVMGTACDDGGPQTLWLLTIQDGKSDEPALSFVLNDEAPQTILRLRCDQPDGCDGLIRVEVLEPDACSLLRTSGVEECEVGMAAASATVATLEVDPQRRILALDVSTEDGQDFETSVDVPVVAAFEEDITLIVTRAEGMPELQMRAGWVVEPPPMQMFFDDFTYSRFDDPVFLARGWRARSQGGGPGPLGATWGPEQVLFLADPDDATNKVLRLVARTQGTAEGTTQAEVFSQQRFFEGTYAARVRHTDSPAVGPDVDGIVQTFFSITPWSYAQSLDYCEVDFEYLPNGGWGVDGATMWQTTWEIAEPSNSVSATQNSSHEGWRTLVFVVSGGNVHYFVDGVPVSTHGGEHYPESEMGIHFNHWFITNMLNESTEVREWHQDVDWVFFAQDVVLSPDDVLAEVQNFRADGTTHHDSVP